MLIVYSSSYEVYEQLEESMNESFYFRVIKKTKRR